MALEFVLRAQEKTVPVVIDGVEYRAKAGSARAVAALSELARSMRPLGDLARDAMGAEQVEEAVRAVQAIDAPLRAAVAALFGPDAVGGIVGADTADLGTCVAVTRMLTAVVESDEYLQATAERVSQMARVAGED